MTNKNIGKPVQLDIVFEYPTGARKRMCEEGPEIEELGAIFFANSGSVQALEQWIASAQTALETLKGLAQNGDENQDYSVLLVGRDGQIKRSCSISSHQPDFGRSPSVVRPVAEAEAPGLLHA